MHNKQTYWLVFDEDNNVVYKSSKRENAEAYIAHATSNFTA